MPFRSVVLKKPAFFCCFVFAWIAAGFADPAEIVVAGYNVENYTVTDRRDGNVHEKNAPKPEKEKEALFRIIKEINPDILGVCEMGPKDQFEDFKKHLEDAGLGYKDFEFVDGPDPQRHLALVSRFPIIERHSVVDAGYKLDGKEEKVKRGFLDVTIQVTPDYKLRLVGCHLKSKLAVPEGEALVRRNEAHLLHQHVARILEQDPKTNLLVYGDFNDTKNEPPLHEIMGPRAAPDHLYDLWLKDDRGETWTHFWKFADIYSRIDFLLVNKALMPEIAFEKSRIYRGSDWSAASDHCPVVATIRPVNREKK